MFICVLVYPIVFSHGGTKKESCGKEVCFSLCLSVSVRVILFSLLTE